jgi:hypothetical protein
MPVMSLGTGDITSWSLISTLYSMDLILRFMVWSWFRCGAKCNVGVHTDIHMTSWNLFSAPGNKKCSIWWSLWVFPFN